MSNLGSLNLNDVGKGLVVTVLSSVLTVIYSSLSTGSLTFDYKNILTVGLTAGVGYLMKNVLTGSGGQIGTNSPPPLPPPEPKK